MRTIAALALLALSASPTFACGGGAAGGAHPVKAEKKTDLKQPQFAHTRCNVRPRPIEKTGKPS